MGQKGPYRQKGWVTRRSFPVRTPLFDRDSAGIPSVFSSSVSSEKPVQRLAPGTGPLAANIAGDCQSEFENLKWGILPVPDSQAT